MATKKKAETPDRRKFNASEAILNFIAFASVRDQPLTLSAHHDVSPISELFSHFKEFHKLPDVRENMMRTTILPGTVHLTNAPRQAVNAVMPTPSQIATKILEQLAHLGYGEQNLAVAKVLDVLKKDRERQYQQFEHTRNVAAQDETKAYQRLSEFNNIVNGNFALLT